MNKIKGNPYLQTVIRDHPDVLQGRIDLLRRALSDAADALEHANDLLGPDTNQIIGREAAHNRARAALREKW
jgi:hypothetical protein